MMKKSIFAVAVASVLTLGAAQAETVLYGSIRYDYQSKKIEDYDKKSDESLDYKIKRFTGKRVSNLADAGSRIGLKGSEDLGNNNAVIYQLEWGFDGMVQNEKEDSKWTTRKAILGLTGDWGTFTAGRQDNPFKVTIVDDTVTDGFNGKDTISSAAQRAMTTTLTGTGLAVYNKAVGKPGEDNYEPAEFIGTNINKGPEFSRVGKVIAYTTPDFAGFQANAAIMMDDSYYLDGKNNNKNIDLWTINARYLYDLGANGQILAKAGYIQGKVADDNNKSKAWGLMLGYDQDAFGVTAAYADGNHKSPFGKDAGTTTNENGSVQGNGPKAKSKGWDLGGRFSFGPNYFSTIRVAYGENQVKVDGNKDKVKSWAVGFEQKLSTRTRAWVEYGATEAKYHVTPGEKQKDNVVSIGMRHDF